MDKRTSKNGVKQNEDVKIITPIKTKYKILLSISFIIGLLPFLTFIHSSFLHVNNRTITSLPSSSDIYNLEWNKTWGGFDWDHGNGIALDDMGNAFITGQTGNAAFILKYDPSGNLLWNKTWGGTGYEVGLGIIVDDLGNVFITGETHRFDIRFSDAFLLKYDPSGNLLWDATWGGPFYDLGRGIALDGSGNVFITGHTWNYVASDETMDPDVFLLKYDPSGNLLWDTTWGDSASDYGFGIAIDDLGNAFITGETYSYGAGRSDAFLLKYDPSGNLLWDTTWGGSDWDHGSGIALDDLGNAFITGQRGNDAILLKYDSTGNLLWDTTWGGPFYDQGRGIALDGSGNVFITGETWNPFAENIYIILLKYNSSGNLLLNKTWKGFSESRGNGIAVSDSGNMFITGFNYRYSTVENAVLVLKFTLDTDEDGLIDDDEVNIHKTDLNDSDTDGDGLSDGDEVNIHGTDPNDSDTDGDGFSDAQEIQLSTDPLSGLSNLLITLTIIIVIVISVGAVFLILIIKYRNYNKANHISRTIPHH